VPPQLVAYRTYEQFLSRAWTRLDAAWVAEQAGEITGFVVIKSDEIEQLYVDRPARGSGVASVLLRQGEAEIRAAGYQRAWLAVVAGNRRARAFYARLGWRDTGAMTYMAETEAGPFAVPTHRYEIDL
jgi:GNAT superfamily N-acetyltransferase